MAKDHGHDLFNDGVIFSGEGGGTRGSQKEPQVDAPPTLAELGIDKKTSMIAQRLATMPEEIRQEDGHGVAWLCSRKIFVTRY
jgi:hypothetical protein